jgi:hypothetical protein
MTTSREAIAQTEKRLAEVESLQLTVQAVELELGAYRQLLMEKLALLRGERLPDEEVMTQVSQPEPPPPMAVPVSPPPVAVPEPPPPVAVPEPIRPVRKLRDTRQFTLPPPNPEPVAAERVAPAPVAPLPVPAPPVAPAPKSGDSRKLARPVTHQERRTAPRRSGNPVSVQVSLSGGGEPFQGWVVDRSSGGLRLLVDQSVNLGTVLNVRPTKAHPGFAAVQVKVKSCRPERNSFNLGCQFLQKVSWEQMQLFG